MDSAPRKERPYRWWAFKHWLNLGFLAIGGVAAATIDPSVLLAVVPIELGVLWMIPDLPPFRARVDHEITSQEIVKERTYYLEQLFRLAPLPRRSLGERIAGWFTEKPEDLDGRIVDFKSPACREYLEMRAMIAKLRDLEQLRDVVLERDWNRFEQVVNGYLRFVLAARALAATVDELDEDSLARELADIDKKLERANPELRTVLLERRRLKQAVLERLPKLQATLELLRTRADTIVHQLRSIHGQVLSDPGTNVNSFLEDLIERQEILMDPLGALEADQEVLQALRPEVQRAQAAARAQSQRGQG